MLSLGTGLSDGYPLGGIDGHESNKFFSQLPYDVLAIGKYVLPFQHGICIEVDFPVGQPVTNYTTTTSRSTCKDVVTSHRLGVLTCNTDRHKNFAPKFNGRYLSSNANITVNDTIGNPISVPVGGEYFIEPLSH